MNCCNAASHLYMLGHQVTLLYSLHFSFRSFWNILLTLGMHSHCAVFLLQSSAQVRLGRYRFKLHAGRGVSVGGLVGVGADRFRSDRFRSDV